MGEFEGCMFTPNNIVVIIVGTGQKVLLMQVAYLKLWHGGGNKIIFYCSLVIGNYFIVL